jgi:hypothetical protein
MSHVKAYAPTTKAVTGCESTHEIRLSAMGEIIRNCPHKIGGWEGAIVLSSS